MSFFQNPFAEEFIAVWVLGDRHQSLDFKCPINAGRGTEIVYTWTSGPYDLSGNDSDGNTTNTLVIQFAINNRKNWATCSVNIASGAASSSAVTATEIVANLNANATFATFFTASVGHHPSDNANITATRVVIRQIKASDRFWFYIANGRAEEKLGFNKRAGVAELPGFFARHTVANRFTYTDGQNQLIALAPGTASQAALINNAVDPSGVSMGYSSGTVQEDYQLLRGRSGIFTFQKLTVDGSDRITQIIEYHAGSVAGDMARKITYSYTGAKTKPDKIAEVPYVLQSADLVTP